MFSDSQERQKTLGAQLQERSHYRRVSIDKAYAPMNRNDDIGTLAVSEKLTRRPFSSAIGCPVMVHILNDHARVDRSRTKNAPKLTHHKLFGIPKLHRFTADVNGCKASFTARELN